MSEILLARAVARLMEATHICKGGNPRRFDGIAVTGAADRNGGGVLDLNGVDIPNATPVCLGHDLSALIGWVHMVHRRRGAIEVAVVVASVKQYGPLQQRLDEAWDRIVRREITGLSVAFRPGKETEIGTGVFHVHRSRVKELSVVENAAIPGCGIFEVWQ